MSHNIESYKVKLIYVDIPYRSKDFFFISSQIQKHTQSLHNVTHLDETSHMSAEFVFRYGPKCMGGLSHITDSCFIAYNF